MQVVTDRVGVRQIMMDETLKDPEHPLYFHYREVEPGSRAHEAHVHPGEVEAFYILEGKAEVQIEDQTWDLTDKMAFMINCRRLHGIRNIGDGVLRYMVVRADLEE